MSNSLAAMRSELVQEWSEKNEIKPTEGSVVSHKKVIWKGKHDHEFLTLILHLLLTGLPKAVTTKSKFLKEMPTVAETYDLNCIKLLSHGSDHYTTTVKN